MSQAKFRKVYKGNGSGRFVVSEGIAPSAYLLPHEGLPTLYTDTEDDRFEIVIPKGTIISAVALANGDTRLVPANGTASSQTWGDADTVDLETGATPTNVSGDEDTIVVPARSVPIGCTQYDLYRPFDKGTSQGAGWIARGYVEWPIVAGVNSTIAVGDVVVSDHMGRPRKAPTFGTNTEVVNYPYLMVGKVVEIETFASNFDDGLLSYMQLPSDPGGLREVYSLTKSGPYEGKMGIRKNLDVANVIGAMRVNLNL
jgi:hypothetical protein